MSSSPPLGLKLQRRKEGSMPARDRLQTVRDLFGAYESGDRTILDQSLSQDLTFYSPPDPGIDRASYFERCWPAHELIDSYAFVRLLESGDEVIVTYEFTKVDGSRSRNTEIITFSGDQVSRVEVYFGWDLK
jgi:ketosteroid isomerase-like protein